MKSNQINNSYFFQMLNERFYLINANESSQLNWIQLLINRLLN